MCCDGLSLIISRRLVTNKSWKDGEQCDDDGIDEKPQGRV